MKKSPPKRKEPRRSERPQSPAPMGDDKLFPIVGVGASAGGLEAFSSLLAALPDSTAMAFVFIQHLDPSHISGLGEILSRTTKIPVTEVSEGVVVKPNHVYVIPSNADMVINEGVLHLSPRTMARGQHRPIDNFLRSLAEDRGDQSIAIILSGTASDGTAGCGAIKSVGGIAFAQDQSSAKYSSMPRSAADAGYVDFILPPKGIAAELVRIEKHPYVARPVSHPDEPIALGSEGELQKLFTMLRQANDVDFTHYKQSTLQRRIKRRMVVNRIEKMEDYVRFVQRTPSELGELYRDVLIHVTGFFRDPGAFEALRQHVFPNLFPDLKSQGKSVRIWVPGCSTGEEAYSIAIALSEFIWDGGQAPSSGATPHIQIFATDVSDDALDRARAAVYAESSVLDVTPQRLKRFFVQINGGYQIGRAIRDMCVFARQNVIKDPPFSNLDLISCRNLLIYLGPDLQKRVIPALHYALKPNGYLMVGSAESLGTFSDHFTLIEKKNRVYQKKPTNARLITYFTGVDIAARRSVDSKPYKPPLNALSVEKEVERTLVNRYLPASIVVNSQMEIVQFRGKTGAYLEPPSGHPTFSLSKMAREGLLIDLRSAIDRAKKENVTARKDGVSIQSNGGRKLVNLEVTPLQTHESSDRYFLVVFQDAPPEPSSPKSSKLASGKLSRKDASLARRNVQLEHEVRQLSEQLQSLIEDHETTSEEFKTANEEVLSSNEELQSTNEELETAKEELQSTNEELTTLNEELQNRNTELSMSNSDLVNLLGNVNIPVVMVSNDSRIRRFTPTAQKLLNMLPGDIGRRISEVRGNVNIDNLDHVLRETIDTVTTKESEVQDNTGAWYLMRSRPYKTWDNRIDGAVLSFQDIDTMKRVLDVTTAYADSLIQTARESILVLGHDLRVFVANRSFYDLFQVSPHETLGRPVFELGDRQWDIPALGELLTRITTQSTRVDDFEVRHNFPHIGERIMLLNARRIEPKAGEFLILLTIDDVTQQRAHVEALKRQAALLDLARDTVMVRSLEGKILFWNKGAEGMYGWKTEEAIGKTTHGLLRTEFPVPFDEIKDQLRSQGHWEGELKHVHKSGERLVVSSRWALLEQDGSGPVILEINTDITALKRSEETLRRLSAYLMTLQDEERRRIARELHDSTGQKLAAVKLNLDTLAKLQQPAPNQKLLSEAAQWTNEAFEEVRTISQLLHPPLLDEAGLVFATRWLADGFAKRAKINVDVRVSGDFGRLPQQIELALFRVTQEALSNIHRHSGSKDAVIILAHSNGEILLEIHDSGKGMPPDLLSRSNSAHHVVGVGLLGMRERLSQLGGTLQIDSGKAGTKIKVLMPAARAQRA